MELHRLKHYLASKPASTVETPWGPEHLVYKVMGKLFVVLAWDESPMRVTLKCDPDRVEELRAVFPAVKQPSYFNKRHWNAVILDGSIPKPELLAMIDESYELVFQKLARAQREAVLRIGQIGNQD